MNDGVVVVIQCAASKRANADYLRTEEARPVKFVARPAEAPRDPAFEYANPDGLDGAGKPWRGILLAYNEAHRDASKSNPWQLLPAWKLYRHPVYSRLASKYGLQNLYILSAGWGLIRADFLTPNYDITFSSSAEKYVRRRAGDRFSDWNELPDDTTSPIVFFGGRDYVRLFSALTKEVSGERHIFYNSLTPPDAPKCHLQRYETRTRTNWHYECAQAFMEGTTDIET